MKYLQTFALIFPVLLSAFILSDYRNNNSKPKPNIIVVMVGDMGYGDLGCYGKKKIKTPNLYPFDFEIANE